MRYIFAVIRSWGDAGDLAATWVLHRCDSLGRSVTAACVHTTVGGLQVSHGSCLSCSSAAEVPRITAAAWESHTGETARTRASTVLSLASGAV